MLGAGCWVWVLGFRCWVLFSYPDTTPKTKTQHQDPIYPSSLIIFKCPNAALPGEEPEKIYGL
jgi:hypothetical protein